MESGPGWKRAAENYVITHESQRIVRCIRHAYKMRIAHTMLDRTTYVIMATKTGPHAVSTILPIA